MKRKQRHLGYDDLRVLRRYVVNDQSYAMTGKFFGWSRQTATNRVNRYLDLFFAEYELGDTDRKEYIASHQGEILDEIKRRMDAIVEADKRGTDD